MNGHLLLFGPTGAGKSATLVTLLMQVMAVYRPRLFIVEAGNSFGLQGDYFATQGLSVNKVQLKPGAGQSRPLCRCLAPGRAAGSGGESVVR
jgi:type IV secretory pathway VirB4 component